MRPSLLLTPAIQRRPAGSLRRLRHRHGRREAATLEERSTATLTPDVAARRVRSAGGPLDEATYACGCGCVFAAAVTTTVACPHCGDAQAW